MQTGMPTIGNDYHTEVMGPISAGARSGMAGRLTSSRTLGIAGARDFGRHASGNGLGYATSGGSYP